MALSKPFITLSKSKAYGFNKNFVSFIRSYLTSRYQWMKICSTFSDWDKIITGASQGSILSPLFFNIFINDWFLFPNKYEICNYKTLCSANKNIIRIIRDLSRDFEISRKLFFDNYIVSNADKCLFMTIGFLDQNFDFH